MPVKAPYLPYDRLRDIAEKFLDEHYSSRELPIPIEHIVEFGFGIDIVPMPGLHDHFDIDSFPTSDLKEFRVDEFVYKRRPGRYRFSLAHELSHLIIHRDIFAQLTFSSITEWKQVVASIPPDQYQWIETQAYSLAGLILVPPKQLEVVLKETAEKAKGAGVSIEDPSEEIKNIIATQIARIFDVSRDVINRRMKYDGHWPM